MKEARGFIKLFFSRGNSSDELFFTFDSLGSLEFDYKDALKLAPLVKSSRVAAMIISEGSTYKINNLPSHYDSTVTFPLQILSLELDSTHNINGNSRYISFNIDQANLPDNVAFNIYDSATDIEYDFNQMHRDMPIITGTMDRLI